MTSCKPGDRRTSAPRDKEGSQDHKLKPKTAEFFAVAVIETQPTTSRTHKRRPTATQHQETDQKQTEIFTTSKILVHKTTCSHLKTPGDRPKQRTKHLETLKTARICQKKGMPYVSEILTFGNHSKTQFFF